MENLIQSNNVTQNELMGLIREDAEDTKAKLSEFAETLLDLEVSAGEVVPADERRNLYEKYKEGVTWIDGNGNIYNIKGVNGTGLATIDKNGNIYPLIDSSTGKVSSNPVLYDVSGEAHTLDETVNVMAGQLQATEFVRRLSVLGLRDQLSSADFVSAFSDMSGYFTDTVASIYSEILDSLTSFDASAIAGIAASIYNMFKGLRASSEDTKIEFADDKWSVSTYAGTIVKGMLASAASIISTVLLVAGGFIGKIIGITVTVALWGVSAFTETKVTTQAEYNPVPVHYEFIKPLWQGTISSTYVPTDIEQAMKTTGVAVRKTPGFDIYFWNNGDKFNCNVEVYANMLITPELLEATGSYSSAFYLKQEQDQVHVYCALDTNKFNALPRHPLAEIGGWSDDSATSVDNHCYGRIGFAPSDDEVRQRAWVAGLAAYYQVRNLAYGFGHGDLHLGTSITVADDDLLYAIWLWCTDKSRIPGWAVITNNLCASIHSYFDILFSDSQVLNYLFNKYSTARPVTGYSATVGFNVEVANFRKSFACIPPTYSVSAVALGVAGTIAIVAAVTAAVLTVNGVVARKFQAILTNKAIQSKRYYDEYTNPESPHYKDKWYLQRYIKSARMVNGFANFFNVSALMPSQMGISRPVVGSDGSIFAAVVDSATGASSDDTVERIDQTINESFGDFDDGILKDIYHSVTGENYPPVTPDPDVPDVDSNN